MHARTLAIAVALTALVAAWAGAESSAGARAPAAATSVLWTGHESITSSRIEHDHDGDHETNTYTADVTWTAKWTLRGGRLYPSSKPDVVSGTATRIVDGETLCSGPVTGSVGTPAVSISRSGKAVFDAAAVPGWAGGGDGLNTCYGSLVPPIVAEIPRSRLAFHATAKLSSLLKGTASASGSGGGTFTSEYPAPSGPNYPYANRTTVSWTAAATTKASTCPTRATARAEKGEICADSWIGAACLRATPVRKSDRRAVALDVEPLTTSVIPDADGTNVAADLTSQLAACAERGGGWRPIKLYLHDPLTDGETFSKEPAAAPGDKPGTTQDIGKSKINGRVAGKTAIVTGLIANDGRPFLDDIGGATSGRFDSERFEFTLQLYLVKR